MPNSPYFLIDANKFDAQYTELKSAFEKHWNNYIIAYSYKTNSLPWIIKRADKLGAYAEVVSDDEYLLAEKIKARGIVYNGIAKSEETFVRAVKNRSIVNIDSSREIEWLAKNGIKGLGVGIRLNFDLEKYCPGETSCGTQGGRFGFCYENGEFEKALNKIKSTGNRVTGLHLHASTKTRSLAVYKALSEAACRISEEFGLELEYIDIGGGFFGGMENKPKFDDYLKVISGVLGKKFSPEKTALIAEPGMSIVGPAVGFVTSVVDVKDTSYGRFVITDGSRCQIDPLMRKSSYFYKIERGSEHGDVLEKQVVCGYTCMENDRIFTLENSEELKVGDRIIYDKTGAYTMCLAPLFIKFFPAVYALQDGKIECVRKRWTCENYTFGENQ